MKGVSMPKARDVRILIVDDQPSMLELARYALNQLGVRSIYMARNGRHALEVLSKNTVDVVLSDWNMDDIDGLTLLKVLRRHDRMNAMPFIMTTGQGGKERVVQAIQAGVNNYIVKPYDVATLKKKLEAVIGALT